MNWSEWSCAQGVDHPDSVGVLSFNDYSLVIQAAVAGHGVALGWAPLVGDMLDRGELVIAHDRPVQTDQAISWSCPMPICGLARRPAFATGWSRSASAPAT